MHICFVNYHTFRGTSGIHIHFLANSLARLGVECTVGVPSGEGVEHMPGPARYELVSFKRLVQRVLFRRKAISADVIFHAWTPRERVRRMTTFLSCRLDAPYLVHLEDNEELIYRTHVRPKKYTGIQGVLRRFLLSRSSFIHPERYRNFLARSAAVTCITESLQEFVPQGVPSLTFWPACEPGFLDLPLEPDQQVRRELGISDNSCVLTYTGGVHAANREEVQTLYRAVAELNRRGRSVHLIRCGNAPPSLNHDALNSRDLVTELGELPPDRLMRYIAAADVLVQPGRPDPFNDYRFPSKIPMFLASGRPVILPATNIGLHLTHGENCLLLRQGTLVELVEALERLLADKDLRRGIGQGGRRFVRENLSWDKAGRQVLALYERCLVNEEKR